ncbi:MAG: KGK domain-containing protein [Cyanobacteriota bacterium]|nr:KGK domain-containing protein [Cyanobacteriota bacterium]
MEYKYEPLENLEVIELLFRPLAAELGLSSYFQILILQVTQFAAIIQHNLRVSDEIKEQIFEKAVDCQVLKYGAKEWHLGKIKVKVTVEFCPDEPEEEIEENEAENSGDNNSEELETEVSPLDDLRQKFNQENQ